MADSQATNAFQGIAILAEDFADWVATTFSDPEITRLVISDLGYTPSAAPPVPIAPDQATRDALRAFADLPEVEQEALLQTLVQLTGVVESIRTFADAVQTDGVDPWTMFWSLFRVWATESLRVRNPSAYALCALLGLVLQGEDTIEQLDPEPVARALRGDMTSEDSEALIRRISAVAGALVVGLDQLVTAVGSKIDALYGWDPEPGTPLEATEVAARALTVVAHLGETVAPKLTLIGVPRPDGGPGFLIALGATLTFEHETDSRVYELEIGANGAFSMFVPLATDRQFRVFGNIAPTLKVRSRAKERDKPFLVFGATDGTRFEIGSLEYGVELAADSAGFTLHLRKGKLVISLGDGDGFMKNLPGGVVEVPVDLGVLADTEQGVRFDGGTGLKVNLPVSASLFGVFVVQYIALELRLAGEQTLEVRGGFSLKLGPFQASVDQIGAKLDLAALAEGVDDLAALVQFAPPRGIGLVLDAGPVKGGGYLFIDAERGEYAGALELKFANFGIKAIALITTKRPDGSEGWSLLIMVYGQFSIHLLYGIFWTGVGGMIGLHHRADLDALTAGMSTGALDDVLFPDNPVADAPRIISRYRTLFPIEPDGLLLGLMLELSYSKPSIVFVRLGLIFEVRNALGGGRPATLTKVVLLGQLLVQLPPKETGAPAILKLLVDVVGFYDAQEQFLLIRARLRDSFVGIEGFAKLDLSGEMVLAMRFGADATFVLSSGGFHPAFRDVPRGVPRDLDRLAVSFNIGVIAFRCESYFAITSNSAQAGFKIEVRADFGVASIEGLLAFDALLYFTPRVRFVVSLGFEVSVRAFGTNFMSVDVRAELEGPGEWRARGSFSVSLLFWDVECSFDERWGNAPEVGAGTTSAAASLMAELADPERLKPGAPVGEGLVSLAPITADDPVLAHPLGLITISQNAVPLGVQIDRLGTKRLTEGTPTFTIGDVQVGGASTSARETVTDQFARGHFMELTEKERLEGRSFERYVSGVTVGTVAYSVTSAGTSVAAEYERKLLEPEMRLNRNWALIAIDRAVLAADVADAVVGIGAAGRSLRARTGALMSAGTPRARVGDPPLAVVDSQTMAERTDVPESLPEAVASHFAAGRDDLVVEAFEVVGA
jgi:hypothetical protein